MVKSRNLQLVRNYAGLLFCIFIDFFQKNISFLFLTELRLFEIFTMQFSNKRINKCVKGTL